MLSGRSHCPQCKTTLGFWDLIPVFSWLFLQGKCRYCQKKISVQYPLVELAMGCTWLLVGLLRPVNLYSNATEWLSFLFLLILFSGLLIITVYDLKYLEIPDEISVPLIVILLLALPFEFTPTWSDALIGAAIPLVFFWLQIAVSNGRWIGGGDLRLGAIMGLTLGWQKTLVALFISYLTGATIGLLMIAFGKKEMGSQIPFGPFLVFGTVISFIWGQEILNWYLRLSGLA